MRMKLLIQGFRKFVLGILQLVIFAERENSESART